MVAATNTYLAFQHDAKLLKLTTILIYIRSFAAVEEANQQLFKTVRAPEDHHVVVTKETIFYPQGGGQPSDEGQMTCDSSASLFNVISVRMDALNLGQVLHLGRFADPCVASAFLPGCSVKQSVDGKKRLLYSRLHTAGHVLGLAVRHLLQDEVEGFDELKASHFPESASCEFSGVIEGKWKTPIQERVTEYINRAMPVEIDFWTEDDFRQEGLEQLTPNRSLLPPRARFRTVRIVGAGTYPCGGTRRFNRSVRGHHREADFKEQRRQQSQLLSDEISALVSRGMSILH